ncbi:MAG: DNA-binding protein Alba [Desulfurococcales archaeon]|nr:DNA-binding protein Alba [Desulfurococcales archaeon]
MVEPQSTNAILIGKKPVMNYVLAALRLLEQEGAEEIIVRARGRNICTAVDTVESLKNLFIKNLIIKDIKIGSEVLESPDGKKRRVSVIEIVVAKPKEEGQ